MDISGFYFELHEWVRKGSTYTKGNNVVVYDGTTWFLNGKEVTTIKELPQEEEEE